MNKENDWDQDVESEMIEGPIERISQAEVSLALKGMKSKKAPGLSEVTVEMIRASGEKGIEVMMKLCQRLVDGGGMPNEWKTSVVVPIYKGKGDSMS